MLELLEFSHDPISTVECISSDEKEVKLARFRSGGDIGILVVVGSVGVGVSGSVGVGGVGGGGGGSVGSSIAGVVCVVGADNVVVVGDIGLSGVIN